MGGAKKRSMAQMEKSQVQTDKKDEPGAGAPSGGKKGKGKTIAEKRPRGLQSPDLNDPKLIGEIQRMGNRSR